jgi:shikimate kinase
MNDAAEVKTPLSKPIVLVGPMGVGKTTVGKKLAKVLKVPFVDTDSLVVAEHGDISKIFESLGEAKFRSYEEDAVASALKTTAVVATGGGAVLSSLTRERLKQATVIYLSSDGRHMGARLANGNRPLIKKGIDDWRRIYDERKPTYESVADFNILVSGLSLSATVAKIRDFVGV